MHFRKGISDTSRCTLERSITDRCTPLGALQLDRAGCRQTRTLTNVCTSDVPEAQMRALCGVHLSVSPRSEVHTLLCVQTCALRRSELSECVHSRTCLAVILLNANINKGMHFTPTYNPMCALQSPECMHFRPSVYQVRALQIIY